MVVELATPTLVTSLKVAHSLPSVEVVVAAVVVAVGVHVELLLTVLPVDNNLKEKKEEPLLDL